VHNSHKEGRGNFAHLRKTQENPKPKPISFKNKSRPPPRLEFVSPTQTPMTSASRPSSPHRPLPVLLKPMPPSFRPKKTKEQKVSSPLYHCSLSSRFPFHFPPTDRLPLFPHFLSPSAPASPLTAKHSDTASKRQPHRRPLLPALSFFFLLSRPVAAHPLLANPASTVHTNQDNPSLPLSQNRPNGHSHRHLPCITKDPSCPPSTSNRVVHPISWDPRSPSSANRFFLPQPPRTPASSNLSSSSDAHRSSPQTLILSQTRQKPSSRRPLWSCRRLKQRRRRNRPEESDLKKQVKSTVVCVFVVAGHGVLHRRQGREEGRKPLQIPLLPEISCGWLWMFWGPQR